MTSADNTYFAKVIANRLWAALLAEGWSSQSTI
jgi:hypothetical protein